VCGSDISVDSVVNWWHYLLLAPVCYFHSICIGTNQLDRGTGKTSNDYMYLSKLNRSTQLIITGSTMAYFIRVTVLYAFLPLYLLIFNAGFFIFWTSEIIFGDGQAYERSRCKSIYKLGFAFGCFLSIIFSVAMIPFNMIFYFYPMIRWTCFRAKLTRKVPKAIIKIRQEI